MHRQTIDLQTGPRVHNTADGFTAHVCGPACGRPETQTGVDGLESQSDVRTQSRPRPWNLPSPRRRNLPRAGRRRIWLPRKWAAWGLESAPRLVPVPVETRR
jgi:hypothetical protein